MTCHGHHELGHPGQTRDEQVDKFFQDNPRVKMLIDDQDLQKDRKQHYLRQLEQEEFWQAAQERHHNWLHLGTRQLSCAAPVAPEEPRAPASKGESGALQSSSAAPEAQGPASKGKSGALQPSSAAPEAPATSRPLPPRGPLICWHCSAHGHTTRNCPVGGAETHTTKNCPVGGAETCWLCQEPGHTKRNCPKRTLRGARTPGRTSTALLTTGIAPRTDIPFRHTAR